MLKAGRRSGEGSKKATTLNTSLTPSNTTTVRFHSDCFVVGTINAGKAGRLSLLLIAFTLSQNAGLLKFIFQPVRCELNCCAEKQTNICVIIRRKILFKA